MQIELWKRMSPVEKARAVSAASRAVHELSLAGFRHRHPGAPESECRLRLAVLKLGTDLAHRAYPESVGLSGR